MKTWNTPEMSELSFTETMYGGEPSNNYDSVRVDENLEITVYFS